MSSNVFECYLNGKLIGTGQIDSYPQLPTHPVKLGATVGAASSLQLDDLKIRNYARTPSEILAEYTAGNKPMVTIQYFNTFGEKIKDQTVIRKLAGGLDFQMGVNYPFTAPTITGATAQAPTTQTVTFLAGENLAKEVRFTYQDTYCRRFEGTYGISRAECEALTDFYASTQGSGWTDNSGWKKMDGKAYSDLCSRKGLTCNAGKLTKIELPNNNLKGRLPENFKNLIHLEQLNLKKNQLHSSLNRLRNPALKELNLSENPLNEAIGSYFFTSNNRNLVKVDLSSTQLKGSLPAFSAANTPLKELILNNNRLTGPLPSTLGEAKNLEVLKLSDNLLVEGFLVNVPRTSKWNQLKTFDITRNYIPITHLNNDAVYRNLQRGNPAIAKAANTNKQQFKIAFLDEKGLPTTKKDKLTPGAVITLKLVKQVYENGKFITKTAVKLAESEIATPQVDNITVESASFPEYKIKLTNSSAQGHFRILLAGATPQGEQTIAQI